MVNSLQLSAKQCFFKKYISVKNIKNNTWYYLIESYPGWLCYIYMCICIISMILEYTYYWYIYSLIQIQIFTLLLSNNIYSCSTATLLSFLTTSQTTVYHASILSFYRFNTCIWISFLNVKSPRTFYELVETSLSFCRINQC